MTYVLTLGRRIFFYRLTGLASVGLSNFIMPRKHTKHCNLLVVLTSRERKKEEEDFNCVLHYTVQRDLNKELCEGYISLQEGDNRERNGKLTELLALKYLQFYSTVYTLTYYAKVKLSDAMH